MPKVSWQTAELLWNLCQEALFESDIVLSLDTGLVPHTICCIVLFLSFIDTHDLALKYRAKYFRAVIDIYSIILNVNSLPAYQTKEVYQMDQGGYCIVPKDTACSQAYAETIFRFSIFYCSGKF